MRTNEDILKDRITEYDRIAGPRVGDFIYIPSDDERIPEYTRITHHWGDKVQTGGTARSHGFYFGSGYMSYSGSLDAGMAVADLVPTNQKKDGVVWFFDEDHAGAGRGRHFAASFRVFAVREGADISGLWHRDCPYHLSILTADQHSRTCGYWYVITYHASSHAAFRTEAELRRWLKSKRLDLTAPLTNPGTHSSQTLRYVKGE